LIAGDRLTDAGLRPLARSLAHLIEFRPGGPAITDAGLDWLKGLRALRRLDLSGAAVTDKGLRALKSLPLVQISLPATVGDDGLKNLRAIRTLAWIEMAKTRATPRGVA